MSKNKQQKERDKATNRLIDYIEQSPELNSRFLELISQFIAPVADHLDDSVNSIESALMGGPYQHMVFGFLFEMMATTRWNNEPHTTIDDFLKHRGWREGPHGRRYLRAMNEADHEFLEITAISQGRWIEVRRYGTTEPIRRVVEETASESLVQWDCIAARVVGEGKTHHFTGSILPLKRATAQYLDERLKAVPAELAEIYEELLKEGDAEELTVNLVDGIPEELQIRLDETSFMCWAIDVLSDGALPVLTNTDNEPLVLTRFNFPLNSDRAEVVSNLTAHPAIDGSDANRLSWLRADESQTILGWIAIDEHHLTFETNSVERGTLGVDLIQSLLGDSVGQPMGLHENPLDLLTSLPVGETTDSGLSDLPEVQAAIQEHLKAHYLSTLDESIPMLGDESPRACAADPAKRHKVIEWLKYLENTDKRSPGPKQEFAWMWEELDLSDFR